MTWKNHRAPLLYHFKLCASLQRHKWVQTRVTVCRRPVRIKNGYDLSLWPGNLTDDLEKTIVHLFWHSLGFLYPFDVIGEFKLKLQSRNAKFRSKLAIFSTVSLKLDWWPRKTIGHLFYATPGFVHHFVAFYSNWGYGPETPSRGKLRFQFCDLDLWPLTLTCCMEITSVNGNGSRIFHDDTMTET